VAQYIADDLETDPGIDLTGGMAVPQDMAAKAGRREACLQPATSDQETDCARRHGIMRKPMRNEDRVRPHARRAVVPKVRRDDTTYGWQER
jgi:hypothetical protein